MVQITEAAIRRRTLVSIPPVGPERDVFRTGDMLSGIYEIREELGSGGMGQVFEAYDHSLERRVAIKAAWPGADSQRLRREAKALAAFQYRGLTTVYSIGTHDHHDYIVMERMCGVTLADDIEYRHDSQTPYSVEDAIKVLGAIAEVLNVVHDAGLAHLDVKPSNIILAPENRVVLLDFGLVLPEFDMAEQARVAGTPRYMAPEVVGEFLGPGAGRFVDIYALGVTAYEMLCGRVPYPVRNFSQLIEVEEDQRPPLRSLRPDVPVALDRLVSEMLCLDPGLRPPSTEAVLWQLRGAELPDRKSEPPGLLIVDADAAQRRLLADTAKRVMPGAVIRTAESGEAALAALRDEAPDIMLLDIRLPKMSGVELCMCMLGEGLAPDCTTVSVTAASGIEDDKLLRQLGIRHFVAKSSRLDADLRRVLAQVSGRKSYSTPSPASVR